MTDTAKTDAAGKGAEWGEAAEAAVLDAALKLVPEMGWTRPMAYRAAAIGGGLSPAEADLLLPHGARDLAALLSRRHDAAMMAALGHLDAASLKIRERIARGVMARTEAALADEAAVRRMAGFLLLPGQIGLGARLNWETADRIWRWAGDTATDENHYSKRAILSALLSSVLAVRLASGAPAAEETLARGIDAVMAYEKLKGRFRGKTWARDLAAKAGQARYGADEPPVRPAT